MKLNQWSTKWSGVWSLALLVGTGLPAADFPEGLRVGQITVSSSSEPATFALASDDELYLWGTRVGLTPIENTDYYLDRPQRVIRPEFVNRWREVAAGDYHVLALVNDGEIVVWGSSHHGQLGTGVLPTPGELYGPELPALLARPAGVNRWLALGAHDDSSHALSDDGRLWVWGRNDFGQLGLLHTNDVAVPTPQPFPPGVTRYERLFPKAHRFALGDNGDLYAWGGSGHVGQPYTNIVLGPVRVPKPVGLNEWRELATGFHHVLALNEHGELFAWGENSQGQLGIAGVVRSAEPQRVPLPEGVNGWRTIAAGNYANSAAISLDGSLFVWGSSSFRYLPERTENGRGLRYETFPIPSLLRYVAGKVDWRNLNAGYDYFCAMDEAGRAFTWGRQFDWYQGRPSADSPFGRPSEWARFQRVPTPVNGFGRPHDAPAESLSLTMSGIEPGMIVLVGEQVSVTVDIRDPVGQVSVEEFQSEMFSTDDFEYPVTRQFMPLVPGEQRVSVSAIIWNGAENWGPDYFRNFESGLSVFSPPFQVVPRDGLDPARPVVGVHVVGTDLIEGHDETLELVFARTGPLGEPLEVRWQTTGAQLGLDFFVKPSVIRFAPGQRVVRALVSARPDLEPEGVETATVEISASPNYQVSSLGVVSFQIHDNQRPAVVIAQPFDQQTLVPGELVEVIVSATDADGELRVVLLHVDNQPVYAEALTATNRFLLRWPWTPVAAGRHTIRAEVSDDSGEIGYSNEIVVQVRSQFSILDRVKLSAAASGAFLQVPDGRWFGWGNNRSNALNLDLDRARMRNEEVLPQPVLPPDDGGQWRSLYASYAVSVGVTTGGGLRVFGDFYQLGLSGPLPFDLERDGGLDIPDEITDWQDWVGAFGRFTGLANNHRVYRLTGPPFEPLALVTNQLPEGASGVLDMSGYVDTDGLVRLPRPGDFHPGPVEFGGVKGRKAVRTYFPNISNSTVYFVLREDGQLWQLGGDGWFGNSNEQTPGGWPYVSVRRITNPPGVAGWRDIQSGGSHLLAWSLDGRLFVWGDNSHGELGLGDRIDRLALTELPFPAGVTRWIKLKSGAGFGNGFTLAVADNGRVYSWGLNDYGQLGQGNLSALDRPTPLSWFGDLRDPASPIPPRPVRNYPPYGTLVVRADTNDFLPLPYTLLAQVGDSDGWPVRVEFFQDNLSLGTVTNVPPNGTVPFFTHTDIGGTWQFRARITDDQGATRDTEPVQFSHRNFVDSVPYLFSVPLFGDLREGTTYPQGFMLYRDSRTNLALTVPLVIGGTATAGEDFAPFPAEVTFPPGVAVVVLPVQLYENGDGDLRETLTISPAPSPCGFSENPTDECYRAIPHSNRIINILPPPRPVVMIETPAGVAYEGGQTNAVIRLHRSVVTDTALTVAYIARGPVDLAQDIDPLPAVFSFAAGQTQLDIPVRARADTIVEGYERLSIDLLPGSCTTGEGTLTCYELGSSTVMIHIGDHSGPDLPVINLSVADPVAIEGTGNYAVIKVVRTGNLLGDVDVQLATAGTASADLDFPSIYGPFRMIQGQPVLSWVIATPTDAVAELTERLIVRLITPDVSGTGGTVTGYYVGNTNEASVLLLDPPLGPASNSLSAILIEEATLQAGGRLRLRIVGDPGIRFELQTCEDLYHWQRVDEYVNEAGRLSIDLPTNGAPARFYRLFPLTE